MDFEEYNSEINKLYDEYVRLHQQKGGNFPKRLPGTPRPYFKELLIDVTDTPDNIIRQIEDFKNQLFKEREQILIHYAQSGRMDMVTDLPRDKLGRKKDGKGIIKRTKEALEYYRQSPLSDMSIAIGLKLIDSNASKQKSHSAENKVARYRKHAEMLIRAVDDGTFFKAVEKPIPRD